MGLATAIRNFWDPPVYRARETAPRGSSWDVFEVNGRSISVHAISLKAANPSYDPASLIDLGRSGSVAWTDNELATHIRESFRVSGIVFRCLTIIADAFAEGVLRIYEDVDGQPEEVPEHPLRLLISEPNPEQSEAELWTMLLLTMGMNGYGLIEKVRAFSGEVVRLYPRNPVTHRRKEEKGVVVWEQRVRGQLVRTIPDADMIVVPYQFDPAYNRMGITPVQVLGREIGIDTNLSAFLKIFLDEGGVPPFVLVSSDPIADEATVEAIQEKWHQKYGGGRAWGTIPVLHGGYELHEIGTDLDKMAWPDLRGVNELRIAQGMGVPAHLIGAREAITNGGLATTEMEQAMRFFQLYTISPLRNRVDGAFTRGLLREIEPDRRLSLGFDVSDILALQEDEDKRATRVRADMTASVITLEEARTARGYEPAAMNGETYLRPFSVTEVIVGAPEPKPAPVPALPPATDPDDEDEPKRERRYRDVKSLSAREIQVRASLVDRNRKAQKKLTELLDRAMRKFFKAQGERIVAQIPKAAPGVATKEAISVDDLTDWDEEHRKLQKVFDQFWQTAGDTAAADASAVTGVAVDWELSNPNIQRTLGKLGHRIVGITETTRADVARIVTDGMTNGQTIDQIATNLTGQFEETYKGRALTIARTESQASYNLASVTSYSESGVVTEMELMDNPDHDTDPGSDGLTCAERNGLVVPLGEADKHIQAEHPNGTLAVSPIVTLGEE